MSKFLKSNIIDERREGLLLSKMLCILEISEISDFRDYGNAAPLPLPSRILKMLCTYIKQQNLYINIIKLNI